MTRYFGPGGFDELVRRARESNSEAPVTKGSEENEASEAVAEGY